MVALAALVVLLVGSLAVLLGLSGLDRAQAAGSVRTIWLWRLYFTVLALTFLTLMAQVAAL